MPKIEYITKGKEQKLKYLKHSTICKKLKNPLKTTQKRACLVLSDRENSLSRVN